MVRSACQSNPYIVHACDVKNLIEDSMHSVRGVLSLIQTGIQDSDFKLSVSIFAFHFLHYLKKKLWVKGRSGGSGVHVFVFNVSSTYRHKIL